MTGSSTIIPFPSAPQPKATTAVQSCLPRSAVVANQSRAKATDGKAGMAGATGPVRRSSAGTGLRVGEASAVLPATSEFMDVTAGRDRRSNSALHDPVFFNAALHREMV